MAFGISYHGASSYMSPQLGDRVQKAVRALSYVWAGFVYPTMGSIAGPL
jgi:hypothetical protein